MEYDKFAHVPAGEHTLPPLPYAYHALEPVIDEKTLQIHHDKHHKAYVEGLNEAELALEKARNTRNFEYISYWERKLAFNGSGHILHSIYWTIMAPPGTGGSPGEYTMKYINWYFGSLDACKEQLIKATGEISGSGWGILGYNTAFLRLEILQCEKHEDLTQWGIIPILVCDVWEHAYYLKYQNNRAEYINKWWGIINWNEVEERLLRAGQGLLPMRE